MSEEKKTYAIIGDPVEHSLSPLIHNFIYQQLGLPYTYEKIKVTVPCLQKFITCFRKDKFQGCNVTLPHKQKIIPYLDEIDTTAQSAGAVNTVKNDDAYLKGFNTDVTGCIFALNKSSWNGKGMVVILGAGGACRAALTALNHFIPSSVTLLNRSREKAESVKNEFCRQVQFDINAENIKFQHMKELLSEASLLINTTPVGMWPHVTQSPITDPDSIPAHLIVFDMVPNPLTTKLLILAEQRGAEIVNGIIMLISQALAAQEIWLDQKLPHELFDKIQTYIFNTMDNIYE